MNDLNPSRKLAVRTRAVGHLALFLLAGLLATVTPLLAQNPPTYLFQWGSQGSADGQFNPIGGIAVDSSNNVYVIDEGNNRIEKFGGSGNYLTQWGSSGSGNGQFQGPGGIVVDSSNNVYVIDEGNNRIEKFGGNGNYLTQWGSSGSGNGQFQGPGGIAVDSSNNVYITDPGNDRVEKFDQNGNYLSQFGSQGYEIAVDSSNNVYVLGGDTVEKFDRNGNYLTQWGIDRGGIPVSIAVDSSNNVYVVDEFFSLVEKFDSNGNNLTEWTSSGSGYGDDPVGIAVDSTGNFIYVAAFLNDSIQVFANNTTIGPPFITAQPTNQLVLGGINVTFSVSVVGAPPLAYQWSSNSIAISSATNATFTLTDVSFADSASYSVLVTNSFGSELSSNAVLALLPAVVITQPASSVTATGAVLNGSVTLGSDETVVWFDWGTDTNYGNIAGGTVVPGNSGSNNISTVLNGLLGNVYHYRLNAANDFGIVYGNDQPFTVGFAPTATTLAALNSPNGSTLNATVNPRGWDTTVYFKWGFGLLTNLTPIMDVGAGAVPLNVSSFITGLAPFTQYHFQVVASNHLGNVTGAQVTFYSPPFVTVPVEDWTSVAASADGRVMVAVANPGPSGPTGPIYISTNSGALWTPAGNAPLGTWQSVACSADGSKIIAAQGGGQGSFTGSIYTSTNTGATWVTNKVISSLGSAIPFPQSWESVASSADGTKLAAADLSSAVSGLVHGLAIYTSTNFSGVWTRATNAPMLGWESVALSADGTKLAAVANGSANIYTSPDFGTTWITNNVPISPNGIQSGWSSIASSADGSKLIAAAGGNGAAGFIFISTNSGAAWTVTATNIPSGLIAHPWIYVASSADGSKLAAVADVASPLGVVITSTNSGATWTTNAVPNLTWNAVALSADGARMVVTVGYPSYVGPIYTTQTTPSPVLNLSAPNNVISWIIPSLDFTLQQSPDLMNWTDVTNLPVLNLTNLQNQVTLPPTDGNSFFRLMH
jgi:DNA-binding beta-propeller fold protein YncE